MMISFTPQIVNLYVLSGYNTHIGGLLSRSTSRFILL